MKPAMTSSGRVRTAEVGERGIDAVAEVLRGVDQRAVEIEDQQLERFDRHWAKNANHDSSVIGRE